MSPTGTIILVVVIIVIVAIVAVAWTAARRRSLRQRFGPEYDRAVSEQDSRTAAERELRARERRHSELDLRPLSDEARASYASSWEEIQAQFVDDPNHAVGAADALVTRLIAERGYPTDNFDDRLATLSVEHARTLEHYRDAHEINLRNERGEASTEQLRQALVHYRALFGDLLGHEPGRSAAATESDVADRPAPTDVPEQRTGDAAADADATVTPTGERSSDARRERTT